MTTEALTSGPVANATAIPRVPNASFLDNGILRESIGSVTVTSGDLLGSTYDLIRVPSACRVSQVLLNNPAGSASSAFDIGVYKTLSDDTLGAVVSSALFGSAVACTSANVDLDVTGESTTYTNAKREQPLWQAAGLSADPGGLLAIVATNTATNAASFSIGLRVRWTV